MGPGSSNVVRRARGSQIVPSQATHDANASNMGSTNASQKKNVRKKAENKAINDFLKRGGERPKIEIPIGKRRTLEKWRSQWVTELGIICKQNIPLTCHCWKDVSDELKDILYKKILLKFDVDIYDPHVREAMDSSLRARFKERRHILYQHYLSIPDGVDKRQHPDTSVRQEQWESLCTHFESEKFKKMSTKNKENRKKLKVNHRGGCRPFVCHRFDQRDVETGKEPDCVTFYRNMRYNEKKGWIAPEAEEIYDKMVHIPSQPVEEGRPELTDAEVAEKVLGKRSGYVRGLGHGEVPPTHKARVAYNQEEVNQLRLRTEEQDRELNELRTWKASQEERCNAQEERYNAQQLMLELQAKKQEETEQMLRALMARVGS